jgi:NADH-quinone oxidoreductase subunit F
MLLNQVCYRTLNLAEQAKLHFYQKIGGYDTWQKILTGSITQDHILEQINIADLRGRGGAGFATVLKLHSVRNSNIEQKYVVCNADEGEPGSFKDRDILMYNPHQIIEGIAIAAYTIGATIGYIYIRGEYAEPIAIMEAALKEARKAGLLGENIQSSGINLQIHCFYGAGSYICGEETALLGSLEGNRGQPRVKPPFPTQCGLYGKPTLVNNTETLASIPVIIERGGQWYANLGLNKAKGCKIFSISGQVNTPGNYEVPLGIPFTELLSLAGGVSGNKKLKAIIPGGVSTPVLPAKLIMPLSMDYDALVQAGSMLGTGAVIVMAEDTCMVQVLSRILRFYFHESCGQCTPCREGTGWAMRILDRLLHKNASKVDLETFKEIMAKIATNSLCALGDSVPIVVASFLQHFGDEFMEYV